MTQRKNELVTAEETVARADHKTEVATLANTLAGIAALKVLVTRIEAEVSENAAALALFSKDRQYLKKRQRLEKQLNELKAKKRRLTHDRSKAKV